MNSVSEQDLRIITGQLGRKPKGVVRVAVRCRMGLPQVIVNAPVRLENRNDRVEPQIFPTLYWLTCPRLVKAVSQLEAEGMIAQIQEQINANPSLQQRLTLAHMRTAQERAALVDDISWARLYPGRWEVLAHSGVGGIRGRGIKCLHTHYADYLVAGDNPVGEMVEHKLAERQMLPPPSCSICQENKVAVAKIGTNSVRMIVVERGFNSEGDFTLKVQDDVAKVTRLGRNVAGSGRLSSEAIDATIIAMRELQQRAESQGVRIVRLVGTSALRDAAETTTGSQSTSSFAARLHEATGLKLEIISGEKEAQLSYRGAVFGSRAIDPKLQPTSDDCYRENMVVLDIGGGSTEITGPSAYSFNIGAVRLSETWQALGEEVEGDAGKWAQLIALVKNLVLAEMRTLDAFVNHIGKRLTNEIKEDESDIASSRSDLSVVGVGGTFTNLAAVVKGSATYSRESVNGSLLVRSQIGSIGRNLFSMSLAERRNIIGLQPGREDILPFGAAIALVFMDGLGVDTITVSADDMLLGMALEWYEERV